MSLTMEQTEDFGEKILQLSEFARSIGLKIHGPSVDKDPVPLIETPPEEIKISKVRNLSLNDNLGDGTCECYITYNHS